MSIRADGKKTQSKRDPKSYIIKGAFSVEESRRPGFLVHPFVFPPNPNPNPTPSYRDMALQTSN